MSSQRCAPQTTSGFQVAMLLLIVVSTALILIKSLTDCKYVVSAQVR